MSKKAAKEKAALEAALKAASDDARRMYATHEKARRTMEAQDRTAADLEQFERLRERERLAAERAEYAKVQEDLDFVAERTLAEARKHAAWQEVTEASWLPDVNDESQISAFLGRWREEQETSLGLLNTDKIVHMKVSAPQSQHERFVHVDNMIVQRIDTVPMKPFRQKRVVDDLAMTVQAAKLTENIWRAVDACLMRGDTAGAARHRAHLAMVYREIVKGLDRLTCLISLNVECFVDDDDDFVQRVAPPQEETANPLIKYGLWLRSNEKTNTVVIPSIMYHGIGVHIEPRDQSTHRLPRALQLQTSSTGQMNTVRVMQLAFDPCSIEGNESEGHEFIALDCVLCVESVQLHDRHKKAGPNSEWGLRTEYTTAPALVRNEYPPKKAADTQSSEDTMLSISFELPKTVVKRQKHLKIGRWNRQFKKWEHIAIASETQASIRRFAFKTTDLTTLAVIQSKGFEVPYETWRINPVADDEVTVHLLGRIHEDQAPEDAAACEIQIAVRDDKCKLLAPLDAELDQLRKQWLSPPTLLRLLARAGYNFVLNDADADAGRLHVLTKSRALEEKGYRDIALFASRFAIASSRHNRAGEDKDMGLFRISKAIRSDDIDADFEPRPEDESKWHSVRYEATRCVLAQFREADEDAVLTAVEGHETHLNLYTCLAAEFGEEKVRSIAQDSSPLLQQGLYSLLSLARPFSWG